MDTPPNANRDNPVTPEHHKLCSTNLNDLVAEMENKGLSSKTCAVSPESEGKGAGKRLMKKAEEWARQKGYRQIVLNVFSKNDRAVNLYRHFNYETEVLKMVKEI